MLPRRGPRGNQDHLPTPRLLGIGRDHPNQFLIRLGRVLDRRDRVGLPHQGHQGLADGLVCLAEVLDLLVASDSIRRQIGADNLDLHSDLVAKNGHGPLERLLLKRPVDPPPQDVPDRLGGGRIRIPIGVAYGSDLKLLQRLLLEAAEEHPKALRDPSPVVLFTEFGDSSLNFELGVWTQEMTATPIHFTSQMNFIIEQKLRENDIEIPFPQRDLHVRSGLPESQESSGEL